MAPLRLVFMGTPEFAVPSLESLLKAGHDVVCVYTRPPRPAGRGRKIRRSPVHERARARGLEVRTPSRLDGAEEQAAFAAVAPDAAIVVAYGLILPRAILEVPRLGCLNLHASLLPRWRGAAPIQRAIMAGDHETGVSVMVLDEGLDTGPVLARIPVAIKRDTTAASLHDELAASGADLLARALEDYAAGRLAPEPQGEDGVSYAAKVTREEGRLDWRRPAAELERQVRGLTPWPGAWFMLAGQRVKVHAAEVIKEVDDADVGLVLDDNLTIACGEGALRLLEVQREGKAALDAEAFLRGTAVPPGTLLE